MPGAEGPWTEPRPNPARTSEVFWAFLRQGLTAFGGPVAHLAYFRREFVERRGWLSEAAFADLLAMSQFLPGPASSQLGMAIGLRRAGYAGLFAAWLGFTLPAGVAMVALGVFADRLTDSWGLGFLHGLKVAAAAVILQAIVQMARSLAAGPIRAGMAIGAAVGLMLAPGPVAQIFALAAGGLFGLAMLRGEPAGDTPDDPVSEALPLQPAIVALTAFVMLLASLPLLANLLQSPTLGLASVFYRTGALVFGGGHVVLPLLQSEVLSRGWMDPDTFLAGYGAVQALPGPLFSFAGFVGAAQQTATTGWLGGLVAILAIFAPSALLVAGVLPFWDRLKRQPGARGAAAGLGAVVVGVLAATWWNPVIRETVVRPADYALIAAAWVFLSVARFPPWLVVIGFALATGLTLKTGV
jgi:chromate transporter